MNTRLPVVALGDIVSPIERLETPRAGMIYRQMGVKLWGVGPYERESIDGSQTKYKLLSRVETDDIVVNKIWARNGSVAVVTKNLSGCFVSGEFPTFVPNRKALTPRWFHWLTKTKPFWDQCDEKSRGTSGQNRIRPEKFLQVEIPLPSLSEQRRIVARIEELAAKIEEARVLRQQAIKETSSLISQAISEALSEEIWRYERLEKVLAEPPRNGLGPQKEVESGGRIMLRINAVSSSPTRFVDLTAFKMVEVSKETAKPFTLKNEDVFIVRYNGDINRVAKAAIFKSAEDCDIIYPDKLMRLRLDRNKMLPDFLVYALGCRSVRSQVEDLGGCQIDCVNEFWLMPPIGTLPSKIIAN